MNIMCVLLIASVSLIIYLVSSAFRFASKYNKHCINIRLNKDGFIFSLVPCKEESQVPSQDSPKNDVPEYPPLSNFKERPQKTKKRASVSTLTALFSGFINHLRK